MTLQPKPGGWPRGWWRSDGALTCVTCSERHHPKPRVPKGEPMFVTGALGEVLCAKHARTKGIAGPEDETP